jgi:Lrp/AsnC family leucine-responsive transcriptional regulator
MEFSKADRILLDVLQTDAHISNQDLAARAGLSASACWRRVKQFEEAGVISRFAAILDPAKAGLTFNAIVHVSLSRHEATNVSTFIKRVLDRPEVIECFATTGEADYHLRVACRDKDAYNRFLDQFLFKLPGVAHVRTNLILKDIKSHGIVHV